jgi:hypothetical protein
LITPRGGAVKAVAAATAGVALVLVSACGSSSGGSSGGGTAVSTATGPIPAQYNLKAAGCPSTIILQSDWNPEAEHGGQYELLGANPSIDTIANTVTGELVAHGGVDTGVKLQIRAGGPAVGYQTVTSQLYKDSSITLGYIESDEAIALSKTQPTVMVMAGLEKSPQIIQWSPDAHPDFKTIADIGKTDTKVLYYQSSFYMQYLTGAGILKKTQVDGSYDGTPTNFVASGGKDAVQGFATAEPYIWSHEVRSWDKPLKYQLIADAGFDFYQQAIGVRKDKLAALTPCLTKLVPIMQQAVVDFVNNPAPAVKLVLHLVDKYNNGWVYSQGTADYAAATMKSLGIIGNGKDSTLGNFDDARTTKLIGQMGPIVAAQNKPILPGLTAADLETNKFIDPKIGLTS